MPAHYAAILLSTEPTFPARSTALRALWVIWAAGCKQCLTDVRKAGYTMYELPRRIPYRLSRGALPTCSRLRCSPDCSALVHSYPNLRGDVVRSHDEQASHVQSR